MAVRWSPRASHACGRSGFSATARRSAASASSPRPTRPSAMPSSSWVRAEFGLRGGKRFEDLERADRGSPRALCEAPSSSSAIGWLADRAHDFRRPVRRPVPDRCPAAGTRAPARVSRVAVGSGVSAHRSSVLGVRASSSAAVTDRHFHGDYADSGNRIDADLASGNRKNRLRRR